MTCFETVFGSVDDSTAYKSPQVSISSEPWTLAWLQTPLEINVLLPCFSNLGVTVGTWFLIEHPLYPDRFIATLSFFPTSIIINKSWWKKLFNVNISKSNITLILNYCIAFFSKCTFISLFHVEHSKPQRSRSNHTHNLLFMLQMTKAVKTKSVCALELLFRYLFIYFQHMKVR